MFKSFNSNHKVEGDIEDFIKRVPKICVLLKPPFIFGNVTVFITMMWTILVMYETKPRDTHILKYFDDHADIIQFNSDDIAPIILEAHMVYYLSEFLDRNLNHLYDLLINMICKNMKYVDKLCVNIRKAKEWKRIIKDLDSTVNKQLVDDDDVTADDIKELFDI